MDRFECNCQPNQMLFFENTVCMECGAPVGYRPDRRRVEPFEIDSQGVWHPKRDPQTAWLPCANYTQHNVCNWMVELCENSDTLCIACTLNETIPDLSVPENLRYWASIETAKRNMLHTCLALGLPIFSKTIDAERGLAFRFMTDSSATSEFCQRLPGLAPVMTGHNDGVITVNLAEADDVARTRVRTQLGEDYRTLLGHFRHEIGHYFWMLLVEHNEEFLTECRKLMGDDSADYSEACHRYYEQGPLLDWSLRHISAYASMHPSEDWAETWAHTMHMIDSLDTARNYGLASRAPLVGQACRWPFQSLVDKWMPLTISLNALNRSMGLPDAYPFVLTPLVAEKLAFVHKVICATTKPAGSRGPRRRASASAVCASLTALPMCDE